MWDKEPNWITDLLFEWQRESIRIAGGFSNLVCISYSTALEAAKAYAKIHGIGFYIQSPYEISSGYFNIVIYVSKEYEHQDQDDLDDAVTYLEDYRTCVAVIYEETTPTDSIIFENGRTALTDLVMGELKDNLSCDNTIIISELSSSNTQFPSGCLYEPQLQNIGCVVGATIGLALAAPKKRLVTCMTDSYFQAKTGEMPTMLKICDNSITIVVNTRPHTPNVDNGYTGVINATGKDPTELWSSKVHTKKELGLAIRKANTEEMKKLCFTEVRIPEDGSDPGDCVICLGLIGDEGDVVSYRCCNQIFHYNCKRGQTSCPFCRSRLDGECRWIIRTDTEVDSHTVWEIRDEIPEDEESDEERVEEGDERVFSGVTFELINYLVEITRVREDNLEFQNVEPALVEEEEIDEVPTWDEEEEIDEVPTRDEEDSDEADTQLDNLQRFWEEGPYSGRRGRRGVTR